MLFTELNAQSSTPPTLSAPQPTSPPAHTPLRSATAPPKSLSPSSQPARVLQSPPRSPPSQTKLTSPFSTSFPPPFIATPFSPARHLSRSFSSQKVQRKHRSAAEWLKFLGLVIGRVHEANKAYHNTKARYISLQENAFASTPASRRHRPSVFFNLPFNYSGTWTYPFVGGAQYIANFVSDANADYRLANDALKTTASFTDAEVLRIFSAATHWINLSLYPAQSDTTLDSLFASQDFPELQKEIWEQFTAVRCRNVRSNSKRITEGGNRHL